MRRLLLALAFIALSTPAGVANAAPSGALPDRAAPSALRSVDGTEGGRLLTGPLSKQPSTDAAFRAGLATIRGRYFDTPATVVGVVRSTDQRVSIAAFTATLGQAPVNGMLYTIFDPAGSSRVGVFFDVPQRFAKTFQPLMARFAESASDSGPAPLKQVVAPDGTEAAMVPANWQVQTLEQGVLIAQGPDQAAVIVRLLQYFSDPRAQGIPGAVPKPFTSDPTAAFSAVSRTLAARRNLPPPEIHIERTVPQPKPAGTVTSALLYGTATSGDATRRFETLVQVVPANAQGRWIVQINQISAPVAVFQHDRPLLSTIYRSYRYDSRRVAANILTYARQQADQNNAVFHDSMHRASVIQRNIDRSTAAFVDYIGDRAVVTNGSVQGRFEANTAAAIVKADPKQWHIMSLNEYK